MVTTAAPHFSALLHDLRTAGPRHLQTILDFDHTLTGFIRADGKRMLMGHDVMEHAPHMPPAFRDEFKQIWRDQAAGLAEGTWDMREYWRRSHALIMKYGLMQAWLPEMVAHAQLTLRDRCRELFQLLHAHGIPCLVCSAGFTAIIEEVFRRENIPTELVHIRANDMLFAEDGSLAGFGDPMITSVNKGLLGQWDAEYFRGAERKCVLLAGDSLRDPDCLQSIEGVDQAIRVGFYDSRAKPGQAAEYERTYDVVFSNEGLPLEQDLDMGPLIDLLGQVLVDSGSSAA